MKKEEILADKIGRRKPWSLPDGYFDELASKIETSLPEYPRAQESRELSMWQKCRPYLYLAAMFAGIWMMMNVIHRTGGFGSQTSLDTPPEHIAAYMSELDYSDDLSSSSSLSDEELLQEVSAQYNDIAEFEKEFGYTIKPQYDKITI